MTNVSGRPDDLPRVQQLVSLRRRLGSAALILITVACSEPPPPTATPVERVAKPAAAASAADHPRIVLAGPTIIAFLPADAQQAELEGAAEAVAHVGFALADTRQCLGSLPVLMKTVYASRLTIGDGAAERTIELARLGQGIGAVLAEPGRPERTVHTEIGASSLQRLLPQAAHEYWGQPACKRD